MDRIIQPYGTAHGGAPTPARVGAPVHPFSFGTPPNPAKLPGDFARALKRRAWLVLIVALCVAVPGSILVLRQPDIFATTATVSIEPPTVDEHVRGLLSQGGAVPLRGADYDRYVSDRIARLRVRSLAEKVVASPELGLAGRVSPFDLVNNVTWRRQPDSNIFEIRYEGRDPELIARLLQTLLMEFQKEAMDQSIKLLTSSKQHSTKALRVEVEELEEIERKIAAIVERQPIFSPGGRNILEEQYIQLSGVLQQKRISFDEVVRQEQIAERFPHLSQRRESSNVERMIGEYESVRDSYQEKLDYYERTIARNKFRNDPAVKHVRETIERANAAIDRLTGQVPAESHADLSRMVVAHSSEEILKLEKQVERLLGEMRESMPDFQEYLSLSEERHAKLESLRLMKDRLQQYGLLVDTQSPPVTILQNAEASDVPVRPDRGMNIGMVIALGLGLGIAIVCALEAIDHRVKVPEHLATGLTLPLLGVVPRIRRLARNHRGGHLWTPGLPSSLEADAFRNLRASLLGATGPKGKPPVTLLFTSAKSGEGKSTTALNVAATCAKAGERTLLVDVDLRRPSLGEVFCKPGDDEIGLVDVLRGDLPWQRAVVRTDIKNLDFLPTGDPTGVPIEILGTLELRQLVAALSGHYTRVILDGPAVLGLADCRMLGRMVDAAVLVVRSGVHGLSPLHRAKSMLEQSKVPIAGVVFNGLDDDLSNWASYGLGSTYGRFDDHADDGAEIAGPDAASPVGALGS